MNGTIKIEGNSNPQAKIGFVVAYPFHYYIYKNIYKKIEHSSEFIIDMGVFPVEQPTELLSEIIALFEKEKVFYRVIHFDDYLYKKYLLDFFKKYKVLVGVWESGCMVIEATLKIRKATVTYGAGKELTFLRPSQSIYDITLDYGKRSANLHSYFSHPVIIGNAKFDDWFNDTIDEPSIDSIKKALNPNKKTLLYLPTHGDLSSVDALADELIVVAEDYNVIVKLHYFISREEPERLKLLTNNKFVLFNDDCDLLPLLKVSDVVLSDNSSAIFDAILADKPIVIADFWTSDFLNIGHLVRRNVRRGSTGALTFSESIEQQIKRNGDVLVIKDKKELSDRLSEAVADSPTLKGNRQRLREELFDFNDGKCAERGARALLDLSDTETLPAKPIMHYAMEAFKSNIGCLALSMKEGLLDQITFYKNALHKEVESAEDFFSVIFVQTDRDHEDKSSLQALVNQNFPKNKFEIISVGAGDGTQYQNIPSFENFKVLNDENISSGEQIMDAMRISRGNIICFTTSDVIVLNDWLLSFYAAYKKDKNISGCGGYEALQKNPHLNHFYEQEVASQIGLGLSRRTVGSYKLFPVTNDIFSINPVGSLSNSSYKREYVKKTDLIDKSIFEMELFLKKEALEHGPLAFLPKVAIKRYEITFKSFLYDNMARGFYGHAFFKKTELGERNFFIGIIINTLIQLSKGLSWRNVIVSSIVFMGYLVRYIGKLLGILYIGLLSMNVKIKDAAKTETL